MMVTVVVVTHMQRLFDVVAHHLLSGQNTSNLMGITQNLNAATRKEYWQKVSPCAQVSKQSRSATEDATPTAKCRNPIVRNSRKALSTEKCSVTVNDELTNTKAPITVRKQSQRRTAQGVAGVRIDEIAEIQQACRVLR